ncbi:MAG: phospho-N-acetylmuramoyl-pentapeptide-transferase [Phycisphaerae bacterium]
MLYHLLYWVAKLYGKEQVGYAYKSELFRAAVAIMAGFVVAYVVGPRVIRLLVRLRVGDVPEFDHVQLNELTRSKAQTPTMGGLIIIIAILVPTLLLANLGDFYVLMGIFCILWLGALGAVDDYLKLSAARRSGTRTGVKTHEKLLFQIGLGLILAYFIYQYGRQNVPADLPDMAPYKQLMVPFYKHGVELTLLAFTIITVVVVTGTSNAVNLTDGMDGLACGCVALVSFAFMLLAWVAGSDHWASYLLLPRIPLAGELAVMCGATVGACLGFLWYNCHPAQVFMGDTGSLPLGGLIGYVAIVTRQELMLLLVGGVFVIEAASVLLQVTYYKSTDGRRIFQAAPIHHHFHLKGWTETQTVVRFWLLAAMLAAFALATIKLR